MTRPLEIVGDTSAPACVDGVCEIPEAGSPDADAD